MTDQKLMMTGMDKCHESLRNFLNHIVITSGYMEDIDVGNCSKKWSTNRLLELDFIRIVRLFQPIVRI